MARMTNATLDMNLPDLEGEDFMVVEPAEEHLKDGLAEESKKPIKLFDDKFEESDKLQDVNQPLPTLTTPSINQAPLELSPLFPFIRSTVYTLSSGDISSFPETIKLRANSNHGPLELDIPAQDIGHGETIHQLAAKRAMGELEERHGWIHTGKNFNGDLVTRKWESRVEKLVQDECERLGVRFQISGKHCCFVAVQADQPFAASASLALDLMPPANYPVSDDDESDEDTGFSIFDGSGEEQPQLKVCSAPGLEPVIIINVASWPL